MSVLSQGTWSQPETRPLAGSLIRLVLSIRSHPLGLIHSVSSTRSHPLGLTRHLRTTARLYPAVCSKACIDQSAQSSITEALACLPVYLSGCRQLLVLAGPTYVTRLWCVLEIFTFLRMGGDLDRVTFIPLGDVEDVQKAFHDFNAANATCFIEEVLACPCLPTRATR